MQIGFFPHKRQAGAIYVLASFFLAAVPLFAAPPKPAAPAKQKFESAEFRCSIAYPETWQVKAGGDPSLLLNLVLPKNAQGAGPTFQLFYSKIGPGQTLNDAIESQKPNLLK